MMNKRGAEMATSTIILLVLGVLVLVMLILGFSVGFSKILPFLSGENIDDIVQGCKTSCATQSVYGFCSQNRTLVDENEKEYPDTCYQFSIEENSAKYLKFGIDKCPGLVDECKQIIKQQQEAAE